MKIAVTGGAGFIGSHLVDALIEDGHAVIVIDNMSSGREENVNPKAELVRKDIREKLSKELEGVETVFHFAADPHVRESAQFPRHIFDVNVEGTFNLLESCRAAEVEHIVFASSSAVYGDAKQIPTPEDYPCRPISNYAASKLACEAFISSFSATYGLKATVLRFANIFGERSEHGVMYDFYHKLKDNPEQLEILGDGNQEKSYLYVSDCVSAVLTAWQKQNKLYDVFNVGSKETVKVKDIAKMMAEILELEPGLNYTGTPKGWIGDIRLMLLGMSKLHKLDWKQKVGFEDGLKIYLDWLDI